MIKRELYLSRIRSSYDSDLIKVITGVRRCGKSVLLTQIMDELKDKGVADKQIIYLNFEDYENDIYTDSKELNKFIKSKIKNKQKYYLFIDEIQFVNGFERIINSWRVTLNISIFITGSNSKMLSGEMATVLSGRYISLKMVPFTFKEVLLLQQGNNIEDVFQEYLEWGGMPQIYQTSDLEMRKMYLKDLYNTIVLKDIIERNNISNVNLLKRIIAFMMENIGGVISANSIANYLKKEKIQTSYDTVYNYVEYVCMSFVFDKVNRYDVRGKSVMSTLEKYYISDIGLLQLKLTPLEKKVGGRLENIVYNELISRGYDVYIGKADNGEVDFIVNDFKTRKYIQVADFLSSDEVRDREFNVYKKVNDNYPKYVITMDKIDYSQDGIIHLNLIDFLLGKVDI